MITSITVLLVARQPAGRSQQILGPGIRINVNTAPWPVLRSLASPADIPDSVIWAILEYRNEPVDDLETEGLMIQEGAWRFSELVIAPASRVKTLWLPR